MSLLVGVLLASTGAMVGGTFAKGQLALATIEGAGLREPIPVDDPENLSILNPGTGSMADWTDEMVESNPTRENVHRILLYISTAESGQKVKPIYSSTMTQNSSASAV